jgi:hypothetical protein
MHHNGLSFRPTQRVAVVEQSRARQDQAQQRLYGTKVPPSAVTPHQQPPHYEPSDLYYAAPVAAGPLPEVLPAAADTPDIERRARKCLGKCIFNSTDVPTGKLKVMQKVHRKLINKDSAVSLALKDIEDDLQDSQAAVAYLEELFKDDS